MDRLVLFVFFFVLSLFGYAQKTFVDSIQAVSTYGSQAELGEIFRKKGISYKNQGKYDEAEKLYAASFTIFSEIGDSIGMANVLNNQALVFSKKNINTSAIEYYYQAIAINKKVNNKPGLIKNYLNLGNFFYHQSDFENSLEYFFLCREGLLDHPNVRILASIHLGTGNIYWMEEYDHRSLIKAQEEYLSALIIYEKLGDSLSTSRVYNNLGLISYEREKYDDAINYYGKGLETKKKLNDLKGMITTYLNLGNALQEQNRYQESLQSYEEGKEIAEELKDAESYLHIIYNMVNVHMELGSADSAATLFEEYNQLRDSVFDEEKSRQLTELQTQYETQKTAEELEQQKTATEEKIAQNRILIFVVISLFILAGTVVVLFSQRQKVLRRLKDKEEELHKKELSRLQKEQDIQSLHAMMEGQDQERKRIAEDLHDRLGAKLSAIKAFHESAQSNGRKFEKVDEMLNETISETREIAHNLAPSALTKYGLIQALKDLLDTLQSTNKLTTQFSFTNLEQRLPEAIETALYYIVQELITNTLRHSEADSMSVTLALHEDGVLNLCYEDNGKGFDMATLPKDSMGLRNMRTRLAPFSGQLSIDSTPNHGVTFIIDISIQELTV